MCNAGGRSRASGASFEGSYGASKGASIAVVQTMIKTIKPAKAIGRLMKGPS